MSWRRGLIVRVRCAKVQAANVQQAGEPLRAVSRAMILSNWMSAKKPSFAYLQAAVNRR